jgi:hypothetical protein
MEDRLHRILKSVDEWLRFAEAKNGALIVANGAIVFGALKALEAPRALPPWVLLYVYAATAVISLAGVIALLSFLPETTLSWLGSTKRPAPEDNLLFYGHAASYDPRGYLEALYERAQLRPTSVSPLEEDYAEQIIVNSRIALRKFGLFTIALWITIVALLTPIVGLPLLLCARAKGGER